VHLLRIGNFIRWAVVKKYGCVIARRNQKILSQTNAHLGTQSQFWSSGNLCLVTLWLTQNGKQNPKKIRSTWLVILRTNVPFKLEFLPLCSMGTVSVLTYFAATQMKLILCIKHKTTATLKYLKILIYLFLGLKIFAWLQNISKKCFNSLAVCILFWLM
jgi:hypothetical protein